MIEIPDLINIIPCTGEIQVFKEAENEDGREISKYNVTHSRCDSQEVSIYNTKKSCSYNNTLNYFPYNFKKSCKKLKQSETYWLELFKNINLINQNKKNNSFILVSHHNRLKKLLFPKIKTKATYGLANCFCILLQFNNKLKLKIINPGFPDKPKKYTYLTKELEFRKIFQTKFIQNAFNKSELNNLNLYIVRHGNAMHNKPLKLISMLSRPYDSSLTPLGIYQAIFLGKKLNNIIKKNTMIHFLASDLSRSQHTCLGILHSLNSNTTPKLTKLYNELNILSINRIIKRMKNKDYSDLLNKFNIFIKNYNLILDKNWIEKYKKYGNKFFDNYNENIYLHPLININIFNNWFLNYIKKYFDKSL